MTSGSNPLRLTAGLIFLFLAGLHSTTQAELTWQGQLRTQGSASLRDGDDTISQNENQHFFIDGAFDGRLNLQYQATPSFFMECSYEAAISGGQTRRALQGLDTPSGSPFFTAPSYPDDSRQLFSLTGLLKEDSDVVAYHRLDRLFAVLQTDIGSFSLGRQALTWGNGMMFNPADLVNPFAPSDIIRDYKVGSDMALYQVTTNHINDFQLAVVPRRDENSGEVEASASTAGTKLNFTALENDIDLYLMRHYEDTVYGLGINRVLGSALFRSDIIVTDGADQAGTYISAVANLDYSWTWATKNWYGLLELYYNGLGHDTPQAAFQDPATLKRLARGDLFATGRWYIDGLLQYELHPLIHLYASAIVNLSDTSFLLQPRVDWSITSSLQLLGGCNIPVGSANSEFGSITFDTPEITTSRPTQLYLILTWYF